MPGGLHPYAHADSFFLQLAVELLSLPTAVCQPPLSALSSFRIDPCDLLYARVIIATYNQHVRPHSPEPLVLALPSVLRSDEADDFMKSQLPLAAEPVRGLHQRDQAGGSNRTDARNLAQRFHRCKTITNVFQ